MSDKFTTGELSKRCCVSVRTVQYYDKEGLLKPSELSQGGRRLYTEEDMLKLKCICLYRALGFSLQEIKPILKENSNKELFERILKEQQIKLDSEIKVLNEKRLKLQAVINQLDETGIIKIKSIDDMDRLIEKKEKYRKTEVMTYIFLGCYILLMLAGFPLAVCFTDFGGWIFAVIAVILLLGLVYYHKEVNAYICPKCHHKFKISFLKDLFSLNGARNGKYLKCPNCGRRGWVKETYMD